MTATLPASAHPAAHPPARFIDGSGRTHALVPGHRDRLKPGWPRMLHDDPPPVTDAELRSDMTSLTERLDLADRVLATFDGGFADREILSVGCGDIIEPLFLAARDARRVVGVEPGLPDNDPELERYAALACTQLDQPADAFRARVELRCEDVAATRLPDAAFDLVCSWRTLEHIADPLGAFEEMYRVLRPGGLAYHEYNPFFGLDGGHSLVTLDVPWGHVRFTRDDIDRYLTQFRPAERTRALAYYDTRLNRMSQADLQRIAHDVGFETLAFVPRTRTEDLLHVDAALLAAAERNHPGAVLNDLICRVVRVVLRRPLAS
ncbi:MAG TPA: class I SAM-dependent methyltransferase [Phycisphaerae bacterium]|nr:class I SAM-dependent methyltransferase [Phycisphaerales bacterium]HRX87095.1 class I SAM-dependent methyltransferase [Phycisphaerae bacterium]